MTEPFALTPPELRRELVATLAVGLVTLGAEARRLTSEGALTSRQTRQVLPAGLVAAIGGELIASIGHLATRRWAYAGSALVRQLVEVEYLSWAVAHDPADAWEWFTSDRKHRLSRWQPGKIRERSEGRFPNTDYHDHCEAGGHPVPKPAMKILDNRTSWLELVLYETAVHGTNAWHYLLGSLNAIAPLAAVAEEHRKVDLAHRRWRETDPLRDAFSSP